MPSKLTKWLNSSKTISPESIAELCDWMYSSVKLVEDVEDVLEKLTSSSVPDMCQRLVVFYKSNSPSLKNFAIFLLPSLIHAYLTHMCDEEGSKEVAKKFTITPTETQQLNVINNLNVLDNCLIRISQYYKLCHPGDIQSPQNPSQSVINNPFSQYSLPALSEPSIFHNSVASLDSSTESIDFIFPSCVQKSMSSYRVPAIIHLIRDYTDTLVSIDVLGDRYTLIGLHSMAQFCKLSDRIACLSKKPRIPISSSLLKHLLLCADVIISKLDDLDRRTDSVRRTSLTIRDAIWEAVQQIERRAMYCCLSVPLLISRAIQHSRTARYAHRVRINNKSGAFVDVSSLLLSTTGLSSDQPDAKPPIMSPTNVPNSDTGLSRAPRASEVITNASFRPETLPEDIPITEHSTPDQNHDKPSKLGKLSTLSDPKAPTNSNR